MGGKWSIIHRYVIAAINRLQIGLVENFDFDHIGPARKADPEEKQ